MEECQEYYQEKLKFNPDSLKFQEWEILINDIAHELVLGDDEDFMITSIHPQAIDGVGVVGELLGISDDYMTNKLPTVTDDEYEQAVQGIYNYSFRIRVEVKINSLLGIRRGYG